MRLRTANANEGRLLDNKELQSYLRLGKTSAAAFAADAGAKVKIGRRVLYDRVAIDRAIEARLEVR